MNVQRFALLSITTALAVAGATGCATKKYVNAQTAPLIEHAGQLDEKTAANHRDLQDVDQRAQAGIKQAQSAADAAAQSAAAAQKSAADANGAAGNAVHRADQLAGVVAGLDNYKQTGTVSVIFGFDKATLTKTESAQLDAFAQQLNGAGAYILEVTGGTDATGSSEYNYQLSQRRADAVVQYLASKYNVPARRFYLIGIGKDKAVASNNTAEGRKQNRRVEVKLLVNSGISAAQSTK